MDCYTCDQEAISRCPRCGNAFCADHGDAAAGLSQGLCADCLDPVSAAPSGVFFRGSLLALLLGSVLALWLLIRPPGLPGESSGVAVPDTSPSPVAPGPAETPESPVLQETEEPTPTATATATPKPKPKPTATPTPKPKPKPKPTPTATPTPEVIEYVLQEGDNVYGVAEFFGVSYLDLLAVNGLTEEEAQFLQPGDVLVIPQ